MGNAFLYGNGGGGGNALAFRVLGGTSAPSSPKENDIWVNTSTSITSYVFSATQPTGSNGVVWFSVGVSSSTEFNALKKNELRVYPISAKQYVSGKWTDKPAKTYQNGKWTDWSYMLKNLNAEHWIATGVTSRANVSNVDSGLQIAFTSAGSWQDVGGYIDESVDLTNYKTVVFQGVHNVKSEQVKLCIYKKDGSVAASVDLDVGSSEATVANKLENHPIDCENLTGTFYLGIKATVGSYVGSITIKTITAK